MKTAYYEWDWKNGCYLFWNDEITKSEGHQVTEDQFNNIVEKLQGNGLVVEEWEGEE